MFLSIENDYLRGSGIVTKEDNIMYILRVETTIRGNKKICYKLGITDDLQARLRTYRTGNPNTTLQCYFKIKNLDAEDVENCAKAALKYKALKKDNETFCTSLKIMQKVLQSCIENGELVKGVCKTCHQKININTIGEHDKCAEVVDI